MKSEMHFVLGVSDVITKDGKSFRLFTLDNGLTIAGNEIFAKAQAVTISYHKKGEKIMDRKGMPLKDEKGKDRLYTQDGWSIDNAIMNTTVHFRDLSKARANSSSKALFGGADEDDE